MHSLGAVPNPYAKVFDPQHPQVPLLGHSRALTPLLGNGARTHRIGKISGVLSLLTKIVKFDIILTYDVSIARLIPIIKLTLVSYEKNKIKKQV